jgi:hypothetical protein
MVGFEAPTDKDMRIGVLMITIGEPVLGHVLRGAQQWAKSWESQ